MHASRSCRSNDNYGSLCSREVYKLYRSYLQQRFEELILFLGQLYLDVVSQVSVRAPRYRQEVGLLRMLGADDAMESKARGGARGKYYVYGAEPCNATVCVGATKLYA